MACLKTSISTTFSLYGRDGLSLAYETCCECEREDRVGENNMNNTFDASQIIGAMAEAYASIAPNPDCASCGNVLTERERANSRIEKMIDVITDGGRIDDPETLEIAEGLRESGAKADPTYVNRLLG